MFCSNCGHDVGEDKNFCQNCGHQLNRSTETNNESHKAASNSPSTTEKKDVWYYIGKGFGENRENVIRKTKRDGLIVIAFVAILVLFPNNALFSAFDESYKINEPLSNIIDGYNDINDNLNEAIILYNTDQYDSCIIKSSEASNDLDIIEAQIDDLSDTLSSTRMSKDKKLLYNDLLYNYKEALKSKKQLSIYLQYAAESAQKRDYNDADEYINLVDSRMVASNEYVNNANEIMNDLSQL
ncbi:zinc ribbon domain-containing protein [Methanococcoides methylutens]|uniref:Zinc-ribbon domain-containing protein n=1 Tax=Methanococcoides methylutens MM1 TaxID=1434104 RepID=A0A0E3SRK2_METMT|nr:zinc ribbon domain-containing protein [Methanococcoides methylutens]AKB84958.1 hypothetical protein MCMEM_0905 [Methanococcoides methylutens MM1]